MRFQWLKDYQELEEQILYLKWNLNKSKLELDRWVNGDLANVKLEKNSRSSSLEEKIKILDEEIQLLIKELAESKILINSFIGVDNEIVRMKYIDNLTLDDIAEKIGYSSSYVRKKHSEIRKILNFVDTYESRKSDRQNKQNELDFYDYDRKVKKQKKQLSLF